MVTKDDEMVKWSFERIMVARQAILDSGAKPRSQGKLLCPVCKTGTVHWSMASNKHIWATCTTKLCVQWVE